MTQMIGDAPGKAVGKTWSAFSTTERILLTIGSLVALLVTLGVGKMLGVPREPAFNGSLLAGPAPVISLIVTGVVTLVAMVVGSLLAAFIEEEAGLFCGAIGLAALGVRCGPVRPVFQFASGPSVLLAMAFETIFLAAILLAGWRGLALLFGRCATKRHRPCQRPRPTNL